jgi:hypothetical protein
MNSGWLLAFGFWILISGTWFLTAELRGVCLCGLATFNGIVNIANKSKARFADLSVFPYF